MRVRSVTCRRSSCSANGTISLRSVFLFGGGVIASTDSRVDCEAGPRAIEESSAGDLSSVS